MAVVRVIADHAGLEQPHLAVDDRRGGQQAAVHQVDVGAGQPGTRERQVEVAQERVHVGGPHAIGLSAVPS